MRKANKQSFLMATSRKVTVYELTFVQKAFQLHTTYKSIFVIVNFFAEPLSFLVKPDVILHGYQAHSLTLNCSTNDRNATVSLYHRHHPLAPFRERKIDAKKVLLKGQVFTLLNLSLKDQGTYACEAKTEENESIRWPSTRGYLIVSQGKENL